MRTAYRSHLQRSSLTLEGGTLRLSRNFDRETQDYWTAVNIKPFMYKQLKWRGGVDWETMWTCTSSLSRNNKHSEQCLNVSSRHIEYDVRITDEKNKVIFLFKKKRTIYLTTLLIIPRHGRPQHFRSLDIYETLTLPGHPNIGILTIWRLTATIWVVPHS